MEAFTDVDGSLFEGGGQLLRVSVGLSIITQRPVRIFNIRAGRPKAGLAPSHLTAIQLLANISRAEVDGLTLGSSELVFRPGVPEPGHYSGNCGTAGSITLMFQAVLPVLARLSAPSVVELHGGTDVPFSPPTHFVQKVLQPALGRMGVHFEYEVVKFGFMPRGGGHVRLTVHPTPFLPLQLVDKEAETKFKALVQFNPANRRDMKQMSDQDYIERLVKGVAYHLSISRGKIGVQEVEAFGRGLVLNVWAKCGQLVTLHSSGLETFAKNAKRINPNKLADDTCQALLAQVQSPACADEHLQDQVLIFAALANGPSTYLIQKLTLHSEGIIDLIHKFGLATVRVEQHQIHVQPAATSE